MADTTPSNDEANRRLAARIGALRTRGVPLRDTDCSDDEVVRALLAYRDAQDVDPSDAQSERLWAAIEAETAPAAAPAAPQRKPAPIFAMSSMLRWAVAAGFLVAVALGWLFLTEAPEPVQVAAAGPSITTYTAPDGSTVRLRPHSALYRLPVEDERHYRLTGEALFTVTDRPEPFVVEAGDLRVRVLGTTFNVRTWERPAVFLQEGRVQVERADAAETVELVPGQASGMADDGTLVPPAAADRAEALDWLEGEMVFTGRPAVSVAAELEQHFGITLVLPDTVQAETLTGRLSLAERAQSLADLGAVLGGRFQQVGAETFRFVPSTTP